MATVKLPRLNSLNWRNQPQLFERYWDQTMSQIEDILNELLQLPIIQDAIATLDAETAANSAAAAAAANSAAAAANAAAAAANSAATTAQTSANTANTAANNAQSQSNLVSSYVTGLTLTATTTDITVSTHTRVYADGSSVSVTGSTITGLTSSVTYYVYYDDPTRAGGAVTYNVTTSESVAAQTGNRHLVGKITTASAGTTTGIGTRPPGVGSIP